VRYCASGGTASIDKAAARSAIHITGFFLTNNGIIKHSPTKFSTAKSISPKSENVN